MCMHPFILSLEYIKKPKEAVDSSNEESKKRAKRSEMEKGAFGTYADALGETITYRVKNPGREVILTFILYL